MESKMNSGEVVISLDGKELTLKSNARAAMAISRVLGGLNGALEELRKANLDAVNTVIRFGAALDDRAARHLEDRLYAEMGRGDGAFGELLLALINYIGLIQRGGRPLPEGDADVSTGHDNRDEGNA